MNEPNIVRVKETFEQWAMYEAVVRGDYMHHAELASNLGAWALAQGEALRIVDLGCGDAWLATSAFRCAEVEEYVGVDVAQAAAHMAVRNLGCWPGRTRVACGNLVDVVRDLPDNSFNVVLASFSLHHFSSDEKCEILVQCRRVLAPGASLLWIDAVRGEQQSRDDWARRLTAVMQRDWTALTEQERANACRHVLESDFPETASCMQEMASAAGLERGECLLQRDFFGGWAFVKT